MEVNNEPTREAPQSNPKNLIIIAGLILLVLIVTTLFLVAKKNQTKVKSDTVVAKVGDETIHASDVRKEASKLYANSAINDKVLKDQVDPTIEKKILDVQAEKDNLTISNEEIDKVLQYRNPGKTAETVSSGYAEAIKYELLKDKIMQHYVNTRTAYAVGFWIPPVSEEASMSAEERQTNQTIRQDGLKALNEIESAMKSGQQPIDVVKAMNAKYPSLQNKLAINNYIYSVNQDKSRMVRPAVYVYQSGEGIWKLFFDTLFSMKKGDITKIVNQSGAGGSVIHLIDSNNAQYNSYDEWLAAQKNDVVK